QQIDEDTTKTVAFQVSDRETPVDQLIYSVTSSDHNIIPPVNIGLGGSGINRTVTFTPLPNTNGTVQLTISVSDGEFTTARSFLVIVNPVDDPPVLADIPSQTTPEDTPISIPLSIADIDTAPSLLTVSGSSADQSLVKDEDIYVRRSGSDFTLIVTPAANKFGSVAILVSVDDGTTVVVDSFLLHIDSVNDPPQVVAFGNQTILEDTVFGPYTFLVQDVEAPAEAITATATSGNTSLVTNENILVTGTGLSRSITITPTQNANGTTPITIWLGDGEDVGSYTFNLTVQAVNDRPEMPELSDVVTDEDKAVTVSFTASDVETPFNQLNYSAEVSNPTLLPSGNIRFSRTSTENRLQLTPAPNLHGTSVVTVTASDGQLSVSRSFLFTVR
ncbi:MAG: hypothetical protein D6790_04570, partial [Caldilineae bacterium]